MPKFFIDRPNFAWVVAIFIVLAGLLSIPSLPVSQFPTVAPPQISIWATYPGASATTVADAVTSHQALDKRLQKSREAIQAATDAYQIANNRYRGGLATYLDVLTAEDALLASQMSLVNLESRAFSLDVALVYALGGGYANPHSSL